VVAAGAITASLFATSARAEPPEIFPLAKVRAGQKGYGLSTRVGTTPERWEFEVVGVMKNFRPKMSIILVKSDDPSMEVPGFWRGMSGSPLFIDGKLACAFSYGWQFNKEPIGGCTPIEYMIEEGLHTPLHAGDRAAEGARTDRSDRHRRDATTTLTPLVAPRAEWLDIAPGGDPHAALAKLGPAREPWVLGPPLPRPPQVRADPTPVDALRPAAVPLAISGLTAPAFALARQLMAAFPVEPMQAGGTGNADEGPTEFALGGPIAVLLARGDMSFAATGTVSYIDGGRVLAFGHPFFEQGEFYAPATAAEIHTVIPSAVSGFILASPLRELGSMVLDRTSTIMADTQVRSPMIPMSLFVEAGAGADRQTGEFHTEIINNRFLTGAIAGVVALSGVTRYLPDHDHATLLMDSTVEVKGFAPLHFVDYLYSDEGAAKAIGGARGLRVLVPLLFNPFAPAEIERIEVRIKMAFDTNFGTISELRLASAELVPGQRNYVDVVMTRFDGGPVVERIPFDVPRALAGSIVKLEVAPGDLAALDAAPADALADLMAAFRQLLPGNVFAVTLYTAESGVAIRGRLIRDLPASALDRLHTGASTSRAEVYYPIARSVAPSKRVINEKKVISVRVADLEQDRDARKGP
jgi:hypothetical protein